MNRSVSRALEILKLLSEEKVLSLAEISKRLNIPKTSTFDIIKSLLEHSYVEIEDTEAKNYRLGFGVFELGNAYRRSLNIYNICKPSLLVLSNILNKTIMLGVLHNKYVLTLDKQDPSRQLFTEGAVGMMQPLYCTALGKALLSVLSDNEIFTLLGHGPYEYRTRNTLRDYPALLLEIQKTRSRGYAIDNGENYEHICCMAMAIHNQQGMPVAAISVSSLKEDYSHTDRKEVIEKLAEQVHLIELRLGYSKNTI
ncbi:MAG: IclR family transcriptional regulator [Treponema sp.]|jgi:DNA-binding IclR family transcriptional regulator|nr:IclR family transcriptional regulator [Treponema sp.]